MSTARASRFQFRDDVAALVTRSIVLVMMLCAVPLSAGPPGTWSPKGNLSQARTSHTATLLANGKVLIVGGKDVNGQAMPTAELYDRATGLYSIVPTNRPVPVSGHTPTLLGNGYCLLG